MHGIGTGDDQSEDRVATFVVGDALAVVRAHEQWSLGAEHDLLQRVEKILLVDLVLLAARRQKRPFVDQVLDVGARKPGRGGGDLAEVHILSEWYSTRVHFEDLFAALPVWQVD